MVGSLHFLGGCKQEIVFRQIAHATGSVILLLVSRGQRRQSASGSIARDPKANACRLARAHSYSSCRLASRAATKSHWPCLLPAAGTKASSVARTDVLPMSALMSSLISITKAAPPGISTASTQLARLSVFFLLRSSEGDCWFSMLRFGVGGYHLPQPQGAPPSTARSGAPPAMRSASSSAMPGATPGPQTLAPMAGRRWGTNFEVGRPKMGISVCRPGTPFKPTSETAASKRIGRPRKRLRAT